MCRVFVNSSNVRSDSLQISRDRGLVGYYLNPRKPPARHVLQDQNGDQRNDDDRQLQNVPTLRDSESTHSELLDAKIPPPDNEKSPRRPTGTLPHRRCSGCARRRSCARAKRGGTKTHYPSRRIASTDTPAGTCQDLHHAPGRDHCVHPKFFKCARSTIPRSAANPRRAQSDRQRAA